MRGIENQFHLKTVNERTIVLSKFERIATLFFTSFQVSIILVIFQASGPAGAYDVYLVKLRIVRNSDLVAGSGVWDIVKIQAQKLKAVLYLTS